MVLRFDCSNLAENDDLTEELRTSILKTNIIKLLGDMLKSEDQELQASAEGLLGTLSQGKFMSYFTWVNCMILSDRNDPFAIMGGVFIPAMVGMLGTQSFDVHSKGLETLIEASKSGILVL